MFVVLENIIKIFFVCQVAKNASYTSSDADIDFLRAIGIWVDQSPVNHFLILSVADKCTDTATIEELSIYMYYCWEEIGSPVEHFTDTLPLKRCNAKPTFIYSTLIGWLKKKRILNVSVMLTKRLGWALTVK